MRHCGHSWIGVVLITICMPVFGQRETSNELLLPVTAEEVARLASLNEYFIRKEGFFAKRYRIVRVDTSLLLEGADKISVTLMPSVTVELSRKDINIQDSGISFEWLGVQSSLPFTIADLSRSNPDLPGPVVSDMYNQLAEVRIYGTQYAYTDNPIDAQELTGMRKDQQSGRIVFNQNSNAHESANVTRIYSIHFNIRPVSSNSNAHSSAGGLNRSFRVRPLPLDRRFSIVYEDDPSKVFPARDSGTLTPEQQRRKQEYMELLEELGEDPRKSAEHKRTK